MGTVETWRNGKRQGDARRRARTRLETRQAAWKDGQPVRATAESKTVIVIS